MKELRSVNNLIESFAKLPGVGRRSAEKMAYSILEMSDEDVSQFSNSLLELKKSVHKCPSCGAYTEDDICEICSDPSRNKKQLIVVSYPKDVIAFEKLRTFKGVYHVLGGVISAVNGIGVSDLNFESLLKRIEENNVEEVIVATNPTVEGDVTAMYIGKLLEGRDLNVTRLANGLPMGGQLEYADVLTLARALEGRKKI